MPNDLNHERMRWRTMSVRQLERRLQKITDPIKLRNFEEVAMEYASARTFYGEYGNLLNMVRARRLSQVPIREDVRSAFVNSFYGNSTPAVDRSIPGGKKSGGKLTTKPMIRLIRFKKGGS